MASTGLDSKGLEGVVAATTQLSHVDGERGELIIAGFPVGELAERATFEETTWLLWHGALPSARQLQAFRAVLAASRALPRATIDLLRECASHRLDAMDALRIAAGTISLEEAGGAGFDQPALRIVAQFPTIVAAFWRLRAENEPIAPRADLGHAANFLYMLTGQTPNPEPVRGLETYLNTVVDHGLNASTFTARIITSTGSDLVSAVVGAIGALKGPLHGGAPGPALDMVLEIGDASRAEALLRRKIEAGEKLMGFGHRVYKVRDPRADVLAAAAERMFTRAGDMSLYRLARAVEATAIRLLDEYKPGRRLQTNVEFYTALLLHGLGFDTALFTPTFAISRVSGWIAHAFEQRRANRIIRPQSEYAGPRDRRWIPLPDRTESIEDGAVERVMSAMGSPEAR
ncbi:MAG TPA: citrate synthase/methylcitrate synthase [Vicinamibacterales bacterium]|nr:citrate synthase/methylcitrate synthase [Vicinamibacterales bacterium]